MPRLARARRATFAGSGDYGGEGTYGGVSEVQEARILSPDVARAFSVEFGISDASDFVVDSYTFLGVIQHGRK